MSTHSGRSGQESSSAFVTDSDDDSSIFTENGLGSSARAGADAASSAEASAAIEDARNTGRRS